MAGDEGAQQLSTIFRPPASPMGDREWRCKVLHLLCDVSQANVSSGDAKFAAVLRRKGGERCRRTFCVASFLGKIPTLPLLEYFLIFRKDVQLDLSKQSQTIVP